MTYSDAQLEAAQKFIADAVRVIDGRANEDVVRQTFTSHLRSIFPGNPAWIRHHIEGGETAVQINKDGRLATRFIDNLVNLTPIEYESDLRIPARFQKGYHQVQEQCAGMIRDGHPADRIVGVLSDTVRWRAYSVTVPEQQSGWECQPEDVTLWEIEAIDAQVGDRNAAIALLAFLERHLGRLGARSLTAASLASDLGFTSPFVSEHVTGLRNVVTKSFQEAPDYAALVMSLWTRFVHSFREAGGKEAFDVEGYRDELYLLTLAKLICANVLSRASLLSSDDELRAILEGAFFGNLGLTNLVEYDYFGWLARDPFVVEILPIARAMQQDLQAYDFSCLASEDLFGETMAQLARRTRRLLLGQEWTPHWLAQRVVHHVLERLPQGEPPQLIDMCCGSGAMIVAALHESKGRIAATATELSARLDALAQAITGFDIDPLAVMLAKTNWILAAGDWLDPLGASRVTIPVYHADSLFAITPLSDDVDAEGQQNHYTLRIATETVLLPRILVSPEYQRAFDALLDLGYDYASDAGDNPLDLGQGDVAQPVRNALSTTATEIPEDLQIQAERFVVSLALTVNRLTRNRQNGIWAFILRNSYRPGLVAGQFNGLVSNPPWLAMSKVANNPYKGVLKRRAQQFAIVPSGPAFLHTELATVFLLHAVERYLRNGASIGCIVPHTVLNGYHHDPFRKSSFLTADRSVDFDIQEIWTLDPSTFKNRAVVLFGVRGGHVPGQPNPLPGRHIATDDHHTLLLHRITQGSRTAWSERGAETGEAGFFDLADFQQGADIMPRRLFFHEFQRVTDTQFQVTSIDTATSPLAFSVRDAKENKDFRLRPAVVPETIIFGVLISHLLTPFTIAPPVSALLPIIKQESAWRALTSVETVSMGRSVAGAFRQIGSALDSGGGVSALWGKLNTRNKLVRQRLSNTGYLILSGTSGSRVCAAYTSAADGYTDRLVIDQTLNWAQVESEAEALYIVGALNSDAVNEVIVEFQPPGAFGPRHIHHLPYRATPPYDVTQALHEEVVEATRQLIDEFRSILGESTALRAALDPNQSSLSARRRKVSQALHHLSSYERYTNATKALYGLG